MAVEDYGKHCWVVRLSDGGEVKAYAERAEVAADGSLVLYGGASSLGAKFVNAAFAAGTWVSAYAASAEDGAALAVERWQKGRR